MAKGQTKNNSKSSMRYMHIPPNALFGIYVTWTVDNHTAFAKTRADHKRADAIVKSLEQTQQEALAEIVESLKAAGVDEKEAQEKASSEYRGCVWALDNELWTALKDAVESEEAGLPELNIKVPPRAYLTFADIILEAT